MYKLTREHQVFLRVVNAYTKEHPEASFQFTFDGFEQPVIGNSPRVVKVNFVKADYVFKRIFYEGSLGLGESYCEGLIRVKDEDYKELLLVFVYTASPKILRRLYPSDMFAILRARLARKFFTKGSERADINSHYSLSDWFDNDDDANQFYMYWLTDDYHLYTCAKWDPETKTLNEAQLNKLRFYAQRLGIDQNSKGKTLLDLGCGWGGTLFFMAENFGLRCQGITLSTAQHRYIVKEIERRKLQGLVSVECKNAHDMTGTYDYVISIGLLEHITRYHDLYSKVARALNPGSPALFHCIYNENYFYKTDPFLIKYIFPGGATPHFLFNIRRFKKHFKFVDADKLPKLSYPKTLDCWFADFCKNEGKIRELLGKRGKVKDIDFSVRAFKHYLVLASAGLTHSGFVANVLLKHPK